MTRLPMYDPVAMLPMSTNPVAGAPAVPLACTPGRPCCDGGDDEEETLPECPGLPARWLVTLSNFPAFPTGTYNNGITLNYLFSVACFRGIKYEPWRHCSRADNFHFHSQYKGLADQLEGQSFELPFAPLAPGDLRWSTGDITFPNARLATTPGQTCGPVSVTGPIQVTVATCPHPAISRENRFAAEVSIPAGTWFTGIIQLPDGQTIMDQPPLLLTTPTHGFNRALSSYGVGPDCLPTGAFIQGPSCLLTPNG